ncbi:MAG: hypothetical protein QM564_04350 [Bergeyella sp.]
MKRLIIFAAAGLFTVYGCGKKETVSTEQKAPATEVIYYGGNDLNNQTEEITYSYIASNKNRANATFTNTKKENTITIKANNQKFQLDRKELTSDGAKYERNGVQAIVKGDSLIILQDNIQIDLVKVK